MLDHRARDHVHVAGQTSGIDFDGTVEAAQCRRLRFAAIGPGALTCSPPVTVAPVPVVPVPPPVVGGGAESFWICAAAISGLTTTLLAFNWTVGRRFGSRPRYRSAVAS